MLKNAEKAKKGASAFAGITLLIQFDLLGGVVAWRPGALPYEKKYSVV